MKEVLVFRLVHQESRQRAVAACLEAPAGYVVKVSQPGRTLDQNAAMWPILEEFSKQLEWPVNGIFTRLTEEEWKDILTAAFRQQQPRIAQGLNGGMVMLGQRTSKFGKAEFSEFLEFLHATAADRGIEIRG